MPPKKKPLVPVEGEVLNPNTIPVPEGEGVSVEDFNLPRSIVQRLAKGVLPANTQIGKDALLAMSKSATVFINYLTAESSDFAQKRGTKRIHPQDVLMAIRELEFGGFEERLKAELEKFEEREEEKRKQRTVKVGGTKSASEDPDGPPSAKRARTEAGEHGDASMGNGHDEDDTVSDHEFDDEADIDEDVIDDIIEDDEPENIREDLDEPEAGTVPVEERDEALDDGDSD